MEYIVYIYSFIYVVYLAVYRLNTDTCKGTVSVNEFIILYIYEWRVAKIWSTLHATSAYWSMPLSETNKEKTAFLVPAKGKFEFNVTPYGLSNAGASYQRMTDICLAGVPLTEFSYT